MKMPPRVTQADTRSRILALDLGERRTGVAISDELGIAAHTRPAIHHQSRAALVGAVRTLVETERASEVVVGLPLALSGGDSSQTAAAREFVAELEAALPIPVTTWDERLSSVQASRNLKGDSRRKSGELDSAAAAIVLQTVLESRRGFVL